MDENLISLMKNTISWGINSATFKVHSPVAPRPRLVVVCLQHVQEPHDVLVSIQLLVDGYGKITASNGYINEINDLNGGFHKCGYPIMDGFKGKSR